MNRWKTKKKAKDAESGARGASTDSDPPPMPTVKSSKTFMFGRRAQEPEVKPEIDLENALPPTDDFRTSLLMSGLSARFSMLREQDDPKSKIGKASDDSVLFPKRQSRLNDFGFQPNGLSDIAEVSSIHSSIRPPFATHRTDSYHEGYGTDDEGSIMNRKKPTEGNNLFGGRQKIYKIPANAASMKSVDAPATGGMGGRALYDDDVSLSAFQKLREKERQQRQLEQQEQDEQEDEVHSRSASPVGYNRKRETSSTTTTTSLTRSSTAATSVTSQRTPSLNGNHNAISPVIAKTRRLYENGLDQQLHEQQHSAMSRLDSLSKQRPFGTHTPPPNVTSPVMGAGNNDKWDRHPMAGKQSMPNLRAASPPPSITPIGTFDFGIKSPNTSTLKPFGVSAPPLSPPMSDSGDSPILTVQPNDRGKATAMGAFSKPSQAYDETKYSQRQVQMQQGRETPPLRKPSPPRVVVGRPMQQSPQMPRSRADSSATYSSNRSRSNSAAQRPMYPHDRIPESGAVNFQSSVPEDSAISTGTFLESPQTSSVASPTELGNDQSSRNPAPLDTLKFHQIPGIVMERPPESQHPAHRQNPFATQSPQAKNHRIQDLNIATTNVSGELTPSPSDTTNLSPASVIPPADSPTLGPATALSNIRQHLRTDSNTSSVYSAMPSAGLTSRFPEHPEPVQNDYVARSNPWDDNDWDRGYDADDGMRKKDRSPPRAQGNTSSPVAQARNGDRNVSQPSWEDEVEPHHNRSGSSATQKEQEDFQNELAFRRRQIKENLKSFVETESRSASPTPGQDSSRDFNPMKHPALGLLKSKASRGSLAGKPGENAQSKAMKMLGLNGSSSTNSPVKQHEDDIWRHEEEEMLRGIPKASETPPQMKAFRQARRDAQRDRERQLAQRHQPNQLRGPIDAHEQHRNGEQRPQQRMPGKDRFPPNIRTGPRDPSRDRKPPPVAYMARDEPNQETGSRAPSRSSRDRSSSDASLRSKSRNGRYKDDLAKAMAEGISAANPGYDELSVPVNRFQPKSPGTPGSFNPSPIPSPMVGTPRSRSNSVMTPGGYFEPAQKFPTLQPASELDIAHPRPSPAFSVNSTPSLVQQSPVPSAVSTPTMQSHSKVPPVAARKRSINKSDISEPKLISSTSRITTVNLPPGSSLQNGMEPHSAPPIPPVNPRRRQTRTMFGFSRKDEDRLHSLPQATQSTEEMSTFSADEGEKPRVRQKLRKSSSEGGNLNVRARQAAFATPSPALPTSPFPPAVHATGNSPPRPVVEGGMF